VYERLIENWLDSASERSYQAPFCQMLLAKGYTVLHSTRHGPIEFGKDVIARAPNGDLCAYQLKGNPGSRLTSVQVRDIQGQLIQLVSQPVQLPGVPVGDHRSFLVTNGEVEEEARQALVQIGQGLRNAGYRYPEIELVTRGSMLAWAKELGTDIWPSEMEDISVLLEMLVHDGRTFVPLVKLHSFLSKLLGLECKGRRRLSAAEVRRRITSAALLTGVSLKNFLAKENHYASIMAWTMFAVYAIGVCEKYHVSYENNAKQAAMLAKQAIFDSLCDLCNELKGRRHLVEGNAMTDTLFYPVRQLLLSGLMALLWFWAKEVGWPNEEQKSFVEKFVPDQPQMGWLWGEAAIPQWLIYLWFLRARYSTLAPDLHLAGLSKAVCEQNKKEHEPLASPYYTAEDVIRHQLNQVLGKEEDPLKDESGFRDSYSAEGLMHLLVRTGLKKTCQSIWPDYSLLNLHWFEPSQLWQYCLWRSEEGLERSRQSPVSERWENLCEQARDCKGSQLPEALRGDRYLLMLWAIIAPHRATASAVRLLGRRFNECWFLKPAYQ
jgi:hypothetical protein